MSYCIVANVVSDHVLRHGAKVWLCFWSGGSIDRPVVRGLSKGGRTVTKRIAAKRLTNFRAAWVPPQLLSDVWKTYPTREEAAQEIKLDFAL